VLTGALPLHILGDGEFPGRHYSPFVFSHTLAALDTWALCPT
jgi:hypothetical protein